MTTAADPLTPVVPVRAPVADVTALLPRREAVLELVAERIPDSAASPATLLVVGLLHREGAPTAQTILAHVTSLLARSVRHDDWLGSSDAAEFVVVLRGTETAGKIAAERLVRAIAALGVTGLTATAGIAALSPGLTSDEALRRATASVAAARQVGPGTVIRYREPLA